MKIVTLKKRAEFLRIRGGQRWSGRSCVVETKPAPPGTPDTARFGFTITNEIGNAVVRNRLRRRLRVIVGAIGPDVAIPGYDYVVVIRPAAVDLSFQDLASDVNEAFRRVHRSSSGRRRAKDG